MWFWKYCSAIQHLLPFPGSTLPVTAPASTEEREWETAVFIFSTRSAKPELLSTLFLGNYAVLSKCTYLQGPLVFGGLCILEAAKTKFLSKQSPRHCATIYSQSCSGPADCHPPSSPLSPVTGRWSQWCTVSLHARTTLAIIFRSTSPSLTPK